MKQCYVKYQGNRKHSVSPFLKAENHKYASEENILGISSNVALLKIFYQKY
jgi:hypothetical protein